MCGRVAMSRRLKLIHLAVAVRLVAMYQAPPLATLARMRRSLLAVAALLTLAACSSPAPDAPPEAPSEVVPASQESTPEPVRFATPGDMVAEVGGAVKWDRCDDPDREVSGGLAITCWQGGEQVAFVAYNDAQAAEDDVPALEAMHWLVHRDGAWLVKSMSRPLLGQVVSALS